MVKENVLEKQQYPQHKAFGVNVSDMHAGTLLCPRVHSKTKVFGFLSSHF